MIELNYLGTVRNCWTRDLRGRCPFRLLGNGHVFPVLLHLFLRRGETRRPIQVKTIKIQILIQFNRNLGCFFCIKTGLNRFIWAVSWCTQSGWSAWQRRAANWASSSSRGRPELCTRRCSPCPTSSWLTTTHRKSYVNP